MDKVIYFDNQEQRMDSCSGQAYYNFLDYAFEQTDYFMLVYVNYYGKGYSKIMKHYRNLLKPYQIKSRNNPCWPGVLNTFCPDTTYEVVFYKNTLEAKRILKNVEKLSDWSSPSYPQDLAFFKGNRCWFYSVGHEKIGAIIHATDQDLDFVVSNNLAKSEKVFEPQTDFYDLYDEILE